MADANEPTAAGPNAPKQDRMAKARAAKKTKTDEVADLKAQVERLSQLVQSQYQSGERETRAPESISEEYAPGAYFVGGIDAATGKPVTRKRRWARADVERAYPKVTFAATRDCVISPHGIPYELVAGKVVTVPSIVKDLYDAQEFSVRRQSEGYRVSEEQSRQVFAAAKSDPFKGRHFTGLEHVGYGWPQEALDAVAHGHGDDGKTMEAIGWEPEVGFPGGFNGKPLPGVEIKV